MRVLVDANILLRLANAADPQHASAVGATDNLHQKGEDLCVVPQNFYEFWSVATRPRANNRLGLTVAEVQSEVARFKRFFIFLDDVPTIYAEWEKLVTFHAIIGKNVHDTRLVAAMTVHRITHLLTFNKQDFHRFTSITVITPNEVIAAPSPSP
jgi:predicted nucleic acid-binding protein